MLDLWRAFVLGMVQGLTEFIPISSTAHLKAIPVALGWGDPGTSFSAVIQLGSVGAVLSYFYKDLAELVQGVSHDLLKLQFSTQKGRLGLGIILGNLPILVGGAILKFSVKDLDSSGFRSLWTIACASIAMALFLALAEYIGKGRRGWDQIATKDGLLVGLAQALALIPGMSRSGSTLTMGLMLHIDRASAARFSFLLGIPAITLAGLVELKGLLEVITNPLNGQFSSQNVPLASLLVGLGSSLLFSYLSIAWLLRYLQKKGTWIFILYRLFFGSALLYGLSTGQLQP